MSGHREKTRNIIQENSCYLPVITANQILMLPSGNYRYRGGSVCRPSRPSGSLGMTGVELCIIVVVCCVVCCLLSAVCCVLCAAVCVEFLNS